MIASKEEPKNALVEALEERAKNRPVSIFDVNKFFGPGERPIPRIGIRTPTKREQDCCRFEARKYIDSLSPGDVEGKSDAELLQDAMAAAVAWSFCREVVPVDAANPDGEWKPTGRSAFPTPGWVCATLEPERIAVLVNLANEHRAKHAPAPIAFDSETVEAVVKLCSDHAGNDIPEAVLAGHSREQLTHLLVLASVQLTAARAALTDSIVAATEPA